MNCIKCGKDCKNTHYFCSECCDGMLKYPVKPGTPINLPARRVYVVEKKKSSRPRLLSRSEERIAKLRFSKRLLVIALMMTLIALLAVSGVLVAVLQGWIAAPAALF